MKKFRMALLNNKASTNRKNLEAFAFRHQSAIVYNLYDKRTVKLFPSYFVRCFFVQLKGKYKTIAKYYFMYKKRVCIRCDTIKFLLHFILLYHGLS